MYQIEEGKPDDLFTWVYRELPNGEREYLAGTAGRMRIGVARTVAESLNEYSLCTGEGK